jgi:hypothetical protein
MIADRVACRPVSAFSIPWQAVEVVPMTSTDKITPDVFAPKFREAIRVGLNWDRFFEQAWPVEFVTLTRRQQLSSCFMPWYINEIGAEVAYDDPEAVPMRLSDVSKSRAILNEERNADIKEYAMKFERQRQSIKFDVPTYRLPDDQYFVLDRNHRIAALTLVSVPFRVNLWNICGPLDAACLLDLTYWVGKTSGRN